VSFNKKNKYFSFVMPTTGSCGHKGSDPDPAPTLWAGETTLLALSKKTPCTHLRKKGVTFDDQYLSGRAAAYDN
jgi:hypothetical protein